MYFRKKKIKNSNLLQLVESYRNEEGKPRQRVVVSLGDARLPEGEEKTIAKSVEAFAKGERELLPAPLSEDGHRWVDRICKMLERSSGKPDEQCSEVVNGVLSEKAEAERLPADCYRSRLRRIRIRAFPRAVRGEHFGLGHPRRNSRET